MMTIRSAFSEGFFVAIRQWRMTAIVWFIQFLLAATVGMQVFEVFESSIGGSLEVNKLLENYDHTVITDFLKVHGGSITPLVGQLRWLLLVYPVFAVFLHAGLMGCAVAPQQASWRKFWESGATWFFPFMKIALIFIGLALCWTAIIWLPTLLFLEPALQYFYSEAWVVWGVLGLAVIYLAGLVWLFTWSLLARLRKISTDAPIRFCLKTGWQILCMNRTRLLGLLGLFAVLQIALLVLYGWVNDLFGTSPAWIFVLFLVQQAFVFFRIQVRQMVYAGMGKMLD